MKRIFKSVEYLLDVLFSIGYFFIHCFVFGTIGITIMLIIKLLYLHLLSKC